MSKNYSATEFLDLCDWLEGKYIGSWDNKDRINNLDSAIRNIIGVDYATNGEKFRNKLKNDIKDMMEIDEEGCLMYKDF